MSIGILLAGLLGATAFVTGLTAYLVRRAYLRRTAAAAALAAHRHPSMRNRVHIPTQRTDDTY